MKPQVTEPLGPLCARCRRRPRRLPTMWCAACIRDHRGVLWRR